MPVDTSIYSNLLRPPPTIADLDQQNLIGQQGKQNLLMGQQKLDEYSRGLKQDADQRAAVSQFGTDQTANYNRLLQTGNLAAAQGYLKNTQDAALFKANTDKAAADTEKTRVDTQGLLQKQKIERISYHAQQLPSVNDVAGAARWLNDAVAGGDVPNEIAQKQIAELQANPNTLAEWKQKTQLGGVALLQQFELQKPTVSTRNTGGTTDTTSVNPLTGEFKVLGSTKNTVSPDTLVSAATQRRGQNMTEARSLRDAVDTASNGAAAAGISPAAIENAAARYNIDGTIPPLGMGKAAGQVRQSILNRAAEMNAGVSPEDARIAQVGGKNASTALAQLGKSKAMNAAFEKTANTNADLALGLSEKMDRTGIPLINAGIQAYRTGSGSPEATQFAAANQTFVSEYAKIMSGGMGNGPVSDAARSKAEKLLTTSMTAAQYKGNVKLLQTEMQNRMKGFDDQEAEIRQSMRRQPSATPTGAPAPAKTGARPPLSSFGSN